MASETSIGSPMRYAIAIACVGLALAARFSLNPLFGDDNFVFTVFYLAVALIALFFGRGPAVLACLLSAVLAYWAIAAPIFTLETKHEALASGLFFVLTSIVYIYFASSMRKTIQESRAERARAEQLAEGHAQLFRAFNERATNHLQLVAALLEMHAHDGGSAISSEALAEAAQRTMIISRFHRRLDTAPVVPTDLTSFARQLLTASVEAADQPALEVIVSGEEALVPAEQAISVALILFELIRAVLAQRPQRLMLDCAIMGEAAAARFQLRLSCDLTYGLTAGKLFATEGARQISDAMVAQIGGTLEISTSPAKLDVILDLPVGSADVDAVGLALTSVARSTMLH